MSEHDNFYYDLKREIYSDLNDDTQIMDIKNYRDDIPHYNGVRATMGCLYISFTSISGDEEESDELFEGKVAQALIQEIEYATRIDEDYAPYDFKVCSTGVQIYYLSEPHGLAETMLRDASSINTTVVLFNSVLRRRNLPEIAVHMGFTIDESVNISLRNGEREFYNSLLCSKAESITFLAMEKGLDPINFDQKMLDLLADVKFANINLKDDACKTHSDLLDTDIYSVDFASGLIDLYIEGRKMQKTAKEEIAAIEQRFNDLLNDDTKMASYSKLTKKSNIINGIKAKVVVTTVTLGFMNDTLVNCKDKVLASNAIRTFFSNAMMAVDVYKGIVFKYLIDDTNLVIISLLGESDGNAYLEILDLATRIVALSRIVNNGYKANGGPAFIIGVGISCNDTFLRSFPSVAVEDENIYYLPAQTYISSRKYANRAVYEEDTRIICMDKEFADTLIKTDDFYKDMFTAHKKEDEDDYYSVNLLPGDFPKEF